MRTAIIASLAVGVITVLATLAVGHAKSDRATAEYGRRLMNGLVPHRLECSSCHPDAGAEAGELTLVNAITHYPDGKIKQRINECVTRNMNARPLRDDGTELNALVARLHFLADENAARGAANTSAPAWRQTDHAPAADAGAQLFEKRCADCHGKDGAGLPASRDPARGWLFPPLWGLESFPDASEMADPETLARFIHAKMPLGRADLDEAQALDIATWITSRSRPHSTQ